MAERVQDESRSGPLARAGFGWTDGGGYLFTYGCFAHSSREESRVISLL